MLSFRSGGVLSCRTRLATTLIALIKFIDAPVIRNLQLNPPH